MDDQKLKDLFNFSEEDLQANRQGKLSEKQKQDMLKGNKSSPINHVFAVIGLAAEMDISKVTVQKAKGPVNIVFVDSRHNSDYDYYSLHIDGEELTITEDQQNIMNKGDVYIVYYDDYDHKILSLEFVSKAK
jgi:hypothetical protein